MNFDKSLLEDALFTRKTSMLIMRQGYGISRERMFVLFSATSNCDLQTLEELALKLAERYFEIDVLLASNTEISLKNQALIDNDNSYVLENLTDEQLVYLHHAATAVITTCEDLTEIAHEIDANVMIGAHESLYERLCDLMQEKGLNREGTKQTHLDKESSY